MHTPQWFPRDVGHPGRGLDTFSPGGSAPSGCHRVRPRPGRILASIPGRGDPLGPLRHRRLRDQPPPRYAAVDAPLLPPLILLGASVCAAIPHPRIFRLVTARLPRPFGLAPLEPLPFRTMAALLGFLLLHLGDLRTGLHFLSAAPPRTTHCNDPSYWWHSAATARSSRGACDLRAVGPRRPRSLDVRLVDRVTSAPTALGATILNRPRDHR